VNAQHSAKSCEHGSPPKAVELARHVLGSIDCDPMSSAYWNAYVVRAGRFFDRQADGMRQAWEGNVWLNPAGADEEAESDSLVRPGWERLVQQWRRGTCSAAVFYGYSFEQLQQLQSCGTHPARFVVLIFGSRQRHMVRPEDGGPPVESTSPTHGNFMALLPDIRRPSVRDAQYQRFADGGQQLGQVVRPW
jgi:hypothetical protein